MDNKLLFGIAAGLLIYFVSKPKKTETKTTKGSTVFTTGGTITNPNLGL